MSAENKFTFVEIQELVLQSVANNRDQAHSEYISDATGIDKTHISAAAVSLLDEGSIELVSGFKLVVAELGSIKPASENLVSTFSGIPDPRPCH